MFNLKRNNMFEQPGKTLLSIYRNQTMCERAFTIAIVTIMCILNCIYGLRNDECLTKQISSTQLNLQIYLIFNAIRLMIGLIFCEINYSFTYENQYYSIMAYLGIIWEYVHSIYFFILMHQMIECSHSVKIYLYIYCIYQFYGGIMVLICPYISPQYYS